MVDSPKAFCNILNVFAAEISFRKQNLIALFCSIKLDIVKIEETAFNRLENTSVTKQKIMTLTRNLAQISLTVLPT